MSQDKGIDKVRKSIEASLEKGFSVGGLVEFAGCPGTYYEIVGGEAPFWNLKFFGGPDLPENYYKTNFNVDEMPTTHRDVVQDMVIETILLQPNAMEVIATMAAEDD